MKNCPICGAVLSDVLVDAIVNKYENESCPKELIRRRERKSFVEGNTTSVALLLGSVMDEE